MAKEPRPSAPINARLDLDVKRMLELAKEATGRSHKFLLSAAIRSKYGKYLDVKKAA